MALEESPNAKDVQLSIDIDAQNNTDQVAAKTDISEAEARLDSVPVDDLIIARNDIMAKGDTTGTSQRTLDAINSNIDKRIMEVSDPSTLNQPIATSADVNTPLATEPAHAPVVPPKDNLTRFTKIYEDAGLGDTLSLNSRDTAMAARSNVGINKANELAAKSLSKRADVQKATRDKVGNYSLFTVPATQEEFLQQNPNANANDLAQWAYTRREEEAKVDLLHAEIALDRTEGGAGDVIGGAIGEVAQVTASLAEGVVYTADMVAEGLTLGNVDSPLDKFTGYKEKFDNLNQFLTRYDSNIEVAEREVRDAKGELFDVRAQERIEKRIADGDSAFEAELAEQGGKFLDTIKNYGDDYTSIGIAAVGSLPYFFTSAVSATAAMSKVTGSIAKKAAKRFPDDAVKQAAFVEKAMNSVAGKNAYRKAGKAAGISSTGILEGISAGTEARKHVESMTPEQLRASSTRFVELEKEVGTEAAISRMANEAHLTAMVVTGTIAAGASFVTGADEIANRVLAGMSPKEGMVDSIGTVIGNALKKDPTKLTGTLAKLVGHAGVESVEEGIQNTGGALGQNVAEARRTEDTSAKALLKDTGASAAEGVVVGAAAGGGIVGSGAVLKSTVSGGKALASAGKKKVQAQRDKAVPTDPTADNYDPQPALNKEFSNVETDPANEEAFKADTEKLKKHTVAAESILKEKREAYDAANVEFANSIMADVRARDDVAPEDRKALAKKLYDNPPAEGPIAEAAAKMVDARKQLDTAEASSQDTANTTAQIVKERDSQLTTDTPSETTNVAAALDNVSKGKANNTKEGIKTFGSHGTKAIDSIQKAIVKAKSTIKESTAGRKGVTRSKASSEVAGDILDGSSDGKFVGINQYVASMKEAALQGNTIRLDRDTNNLEAWSLHQKAKIESIDKTIDAHIAAAKDPSNVALTDVAADSLLEYNTIYADGTTFTNIGTHTSRFKQRLIAESESIDLTLEAGKALKAQITGETVTPSKTTEEVVDAPIDAPVASDTEVATPTEPAAVAEPIKESVTKDVESSGEYVESLPASVRTEVDAAKSNEELGTIYKRLEKTISPDLVEDLQAYVSDAYVSDEEVSTTKEETIASSEKIKETTNTQDTPTLPVAIVNAINNRAKTQEHVDIIANTAIEKGASAEQVSNIYDLAKAKGLDVTQPVDETVAPSEATAVAQEAAVSEDTVIQDITASLNWNVTPELQDKLREEESIKDEEILDELEDTDEDEEGFDNVDALVKAYNKLGLDEEIKKEVNSTLGSDRTERFMSIKPRGFLKYAGNFSDFLALTGEVGADTISKIKNIEDNFLNPFIDKFIESTLTAKPTHTSLKRAESLDPLNLIKSIQSTDVNGKPRYGLPMVVAKAAAKVAFEFVGTDLKSMVNPDEGYIKKTLGLDSKEELTQAHMDTFFKNGSSFGYVTSTLGKNIIRESGITFNGNESTDTQARLASALGILALQVLANNDIGLDGTTAKTSVNKAALGPVEIVVQERAYTGSAEEHFKEARGIQPTITNIEDEFGQTLASSTIEDISEYIKDNNLVRALTLYSGELPTYALPSSTAPKSIGKNKRGTITQSSDRRVASTDKNQSIPYRMRAFNAKLLDVLSENLILDIMGLDLNFESLPFTEVDGVKAKNNMFIATLDHLKTLKDDLINNREDLGGLDAPLYFKQRISGSGRTSMDGGMNPQGNKPIRHWLYQDSWNTEVNLNIQAHTDMFKLAMLEGVGVGVHKQSLEKSRSNFDAYVASKSINDAVEALRKAEALPEGEMLDEASEQAIFTVIKKGGEDTWSLDSLVALKDYLDAKATGKASFTTQVFREVDGVNNGVMIGAFQFYGADNADHLLQILARGGIYENGSTDLGFKKLSEYLDQNDSLDAYEDVGIGVQDNLYELEDYNKEAGFTFIELMGEGNSEQSTAPASMKKILRKWMKNPLMVLIYGSSINNIKQKMLDELMVKFYKDVAKAYAAGDMRAVQYRVSLINRILPKAAQLDLPRSLNGARSIEKQLTERTYTNKKGNVVTLEEYLNTAFTFSIGKAFEDTALDKYGSFLDNRSHYMNIMSMAHDVYFDEVRYAMDKLTNKRVNEAAKRTQLLRNKYRADYRTPGTVAYNEYLAGVQDIAKYEKGDKDAAVAALLESLVSKVKSPTKPLSTKDVHEIMTREDLLEIAPIIKDFFSNNKLDGTLLSKLRKGVANELDEKQSPLGSVANKVIVNLKGSKLPVKQLDGSVKKISEIGSQPEQTLIEDPGAGAGPNSIFGLDSAVQIMIQEKMEGLNLYDAFATDLTGTAALGQAANQAMAEISLGDHNIFDEGIKLYEKLQNHTPLDPSKKSFLDQIDMTPNQTIITAEGPTKVSKYVATEEFSGNDVITDIKDRFDGIELIFDQYSSGFTEGTFYSEDLESAKELDAEEQAAVAEGVERDNALNDANATTALAEKAIQAERKKMLKEDTLRTAESRAAKSEKIRKRTRVANANIQSGKDVQEGLASESFLELGGNTSDVGVYGSTSESVDAGIYTQTGPAEMLSPQNTESVFDRLYALGNVKESDEHRDHLRGILESVVNTVLTPVSLYYASKGNETRGEFNAEVNSVGIQLSETNGSRIPGLGILMSAQEVFTHELIHKVMFTALNSSSTAARKVQALYDKVINEVVVEDFMNRDSQGNFLDSKGSPVSRTDANWADEYAKAEERHDYIFRNTSEYKSKHGYLNNVTEDTRNPYLHEFAAFGLTNANFVAKLKTIEISNNAVTVADTSIFHKLVEILNAFLNKLTRTQPSDNAFNILEGLAQEINRQTDAKKSVLSQLVRTGATAVETTIVDNIVKPIKDINIYQYKSDVLIDLEKPSTYLPFVKDVGIGIVAGISAPAHVWRRAYRRVFLSANQTAKALNPLHNVAETLDEIVGTGRIGAASRAQTRVAKRAIDHTRKAVIENTTKNLRDMFADALTKANEASVTQTLMYTDGSSLLNTTGTEEDIYSSYNELKKYVKDPVALQTEIDRVEAELQSKSKSSKHFFWYKNNAENLAMFSQTQETFMPDLNKNAMHITSLSGNSQLTPQADHRQLEGLIDRLVTLNGIKMAPASDRQATTDLFNSSPNAMLQTLLIHKSGVQEAIDKNFDGQEGLLVKGYTPTLNNNNVSVKIVPKSDVALWVNRTYVDHGLLVTEDSDSSPRAHLLISQYHKDPALDSAAYSLTGKDTVGTSVTDKHIAMDGYGISGISAQDNFDNIVKDHTKRVLAAMDGPMDHRPIKGQLQPVKDSEGYITDYVYVMNRENRRKFLGAKESFVDLIAKNESQIVDKANSVKANADTIKLIKEDYDKFSGSDPRAFVNVGPHATDDRARNIWNMISREDKEVISEVWGRDGMYVHQSAWKHLFGQRRLSVTSLDYVNTEGLQAMQRQAANANNLATTMLHNKYGVYIEGGLQEFVKKAKDNIVIRGIEVLVGNIVSNQLTLLALGVPPTKSIKWQKEALDLAKEYDRYTKEIVKIELDIRANPFIAKDKKLMSRLATLKERLAANELHELYVAGVYQSIADEIYALDEDSIYDKQLGKLVDPIADRLSDNVKHVFKFALLTHDSSSYKFLKETTQLSDFVARYALHKHNLESGVNSAGEKMSRDESITDIVETFVDYDDPTTPVIQYLNDNGVFWFTKYLFRTQVTIRKIFVKHPVIASSIMLLQAASGINLPDITDSPLWDMRGMNSPFDVADGLLTNHPLYYIYKMILG